MATVIVKPYPKHMAGVATMPFYVAAFFPILVLSPSPWLAVLLWLPCWFCIDFGVSRFIVWQVNSLRRPVWKTLVAVASVGLAADFIVAGSIYALS